MSYDVMEPIGCRFCDADFDCMTDLWQHFLRRHADKHDIVMRPTRDTPPAVPVAPEAAPPLSSEEADGIAQGLKEVAAGKSRSIADIRRHLKAAAPEHSLKCPHESMWFSRTLEADGMMHHYCEACGMQDAEIERERGEQRSGKDRRRNEGKGYAVLANRRISDRRKGGR